MILSSNKCPNCGAPLVLQGEEKVVTCEYCGSQIFIREKAPMDSPSKGEGKEKGEKQEKEKSGEASFSFAETGKETGKETEKKKDGTDSYAYQKDGAGRGMEAGGEKTSPEDAREARKQRRNSLLLLGFLCLFFIYIDLPWGFLISLILFLTSLFQKDQRGGTMVPKIQIPFSQVEVKGKDWVAVVGELKKAGFERLYPIALEDLDSGLQEKANQVERITVNGKEMASCPYPKDASILIYYHSLKKEGYRMGGFEYGNLGGGPLPKSGRDNYGRKPSWGGYEYNRGGLGQRPGVWKNKWIALFLCVCLGFFGAHRFYEGKIGTGILYLFTFGLFGIGWMIDLLILLFKPNPYRVK